MRYNMINHIPLWTKHGISHVIPSLIQSNSILYLANQTLYLKMNWLWNGWMGKSVVHLSIVSLLIEGRKVEVYLKKKKCIWEYRYSSYFSFSFFSSLFIYNQYVSILFCD